MKKIELVILWLDRAKSNLQLSKPEVIDKDIYYEDLCFNAQQCVEKALKAFCIYNNITFPKTHNIAFLMEHLENAKVNIPLNIKQAIKLTDYSVETRYPGDYDEVDYREYKQVIKIAERVFKWICKKVKY